MRLSDTLARRRATYRRPIPTLPNILVVDLPEEFANPDLSLGRYYGIMVETAAEARELNAFLDAERQFLVAPDLLDHRSSALQAQQITIAHYEPPLAGWPFILLCHWPAAYAAAVPDRRDMFARGAYTIEMFESEIERAGASAALIEALGRQGDLTLTNLAYETIGAIGRA